MKWIDLPPVWTIAAAVAMWLTARAAPWPDEAAPEAAAGLFAGAVALAIWAAVQFRRERTTIIPREAPSALITSGPFRFTRNPIYLADALALLAWAVFLGSGFAIFWIAAFVWVIDRRFIEPEEARLEATFGEAFTEYRKVARRWV